MSRRHKSEFFSRGTCRWCGDSGPNVYRDTHYCESCDGDIHYCPICRADQHADDPCRHVFQDRYFQWAGAGVGAPDDTVKRSLFRLLDLMPPEFATDLRTAISSGEFFTWFVAPLIGGGGLLELHGMPDREGRMMIFEWGEKLAKISENDDDEDTADGYRWLASLYRKKTARGNKHTVALLDEWVKRRSAVTKPQRRRGQQSLPHSA